MKYTKKYMVVPFEEESEEELLKRKEREKDQFKDSNDQNKVDKFGEVLQRQIKVDQLMTITRN